MSKYDRNLTKEERNIICDRIYRLMNSEWPRKSYVYFSIKFEVSPTSISDYYKGESAPSIHTMMIMADYFHTTLDYICGRTDKR